MTEKTMKASAAVDSLFHANNLLKGFLVFIVMILPFQHLPQTFIAEGDRIRLIRYLDEISFLISLCVTLSFILLKPFSYGIRLPFIKAIWLFFFIGLISMLLNQVPFLQGFFGIYDVLKNILVIYVFSHLGFTKEDMFRVVGMLGKIAIVFGLASIVVEAAALFFGLGINYFVLDYKRLGFYRVFSLAGFGSWNYLAVYMTLIFYLYFMTVEDSLKKRTVLFASVVTIFLTFSRQAWLGFGLMAGILKKRNLTLILGIVPFIGVLWMINIEEFNPEYYFRSFALFESLTILKENILIGVGPGMFGGLSAGIFGTPYYNHWPSNHFSLVENIRTIDMFWPSVWAEFGIIGFLSYFAIWVLVFLYLKKAEGFFIHDAAMQRFGRVLRFYMLVLTIMGFAGGLNSAFVVFTYFALVGMYISAYHAESRGGKP